ncbi:MAG: choice-of-anchor L domain-containing protein [Saprospiraceae bacterium]|nr:choice-of-anchor L domain-containing protein [Saprospiraceae bacterium]
MGGSFIHALSCYTSIVSIFSKRKLLIAFFSLCSITAFSQRKGYQKTPNTFNSRVQATTNSPEAIQTLVRDVFLGGGCIEIENIQVSSEVSGTSLAQIGRFTQSPGLDIGYSDGIVLSTGNVADVLAPNESGSTTGSFGTAGDTDLNAIFGVNSFDAARIQFDFRPSTDSISFNFVFASDEYPEYVCSEFKDAFAFLIREAGTTNPWENMALVPNTTLPVSINSINSGTPGALATGNCDELGESLANALLYRSDNESTGSMRHEFDGYTTSLEASTTGLSTCQWYTFKMVIADVTDTGLDSAVFLEGGSFSDGSDLEINPQGTVDGTADAVEGCRGGQFVFQRGGDLDTSLPYTLNFEISGTAVEGVDFETLPRSIDFPPNVIQVALPVFPIVDNVDEPDETIILTTTNADLTCGCQSENFSSTVTIIDYQMSIGREVDSFCEGDTYTLPDGTVVSEPGVYVEVIPRFECDSIVEITLTELPTYDIDVPIEACDGETVSLPDGTSVTTTGDYVSNLISIDGCDSTVTYLVTFNPTFNTPLDAEICSGDAFVFPDGSTQSDVTPGTYTQVSMLSTEFGCDSLVTTTLTIHPIYDIDESAEVCAGQAFIYPDGTPAPTEAGTYNYASSLLSIDNCDSIVNTVLTVHPNYRDTVNIGICDNQPYTLPDGTDVVATGEYITPLLSINGCDSIIHTFLQVDVTYEIEENPGICEGETYVLPDGTVVNMTGQYITPLVTSRACDSIITTNLTVFPVYDIVLNDTICDNETYLLPDGVETNVGGIYDYAYTTVLGNCDSLITVNLVVNPTQVDAPLNIDLCENETYILPDGQVLSTDGSYTTTVDNQFGCDSTVTVNITTYNADTLFVVDSICIEQNWELPDGTLVGPGNYETHLTYSTSTCDSLVVFSEISAYEEVFTDLVATTCSDIPHILPDGLSVNETGLYTSILTSSEGCDSLIFTDLTVLPAYNTLDTAFICEQDFFIVPSTNEQINLEGLVTEFLETEAGCDSIVNYFVKVLRCTRPGCMDVSTAFSPNGDGINDRFIPLVPNGCTVSDVKFTVFDRWGNLIFETTGILSSWDGTFDGQLAPVGTYLWNAEYTYSDENVTDRFVEVAGSVQLLK